MVTIKKSRLLKYLEMKCSLPRQPSSQVKGAKLRRPNSVIYLKLNYSNVRYPNLLILTSVRNDGGSQLTLNATYNCIYTA